MSLKTFAYDQYPAQDDINYAEEANIGYPAIDNLERKLLGGAYVQEDIYQRLNRLETRIFGQVSNAPLADRVDRLEEAAGIADKKDSDTTYSTRNMIFGQRGGQYRSYNNYYGGYDDQYSSNANGYYNSEPDEYYTDQPQSSMLESTIPSLLLMLLQAFL